MKTRDFIRTVLFSPLAFLTGCIDPEKWKRDPRSFHHQPMGEIPSTSDRAAALTNLFPSVKERAADLSSPPPCHLLLCQLEEESLADAIKGMDWNLRINVDDYQRLSMWVCRRLHNPATGEYRRLMSVQYVANLDEYPSTILHGLRQLKRDVDFYQKRGDLAWHEAKPKEINPIMWMCLDGVPFNVQIKPTKPLV